MIIGGNKITKILIIEDDIALSNGIILALKNDNYMFEQARSLCEATIKMSEQSFELLILDINLPDGNGLTFLSGIRKNSAMPIIILTANDLETDVVSGLELGADDYITKPFSLMVLRARVNNQIRKKQLFKANIIQINDFLFDFGKMEFSKRGNVFELSKTEQKLLRILVESKGITLSRADLMDRVWTDGSEYVEENALSVTIKRLRDKVEDIPAEPKYIKTIYGIGYTWAVR